MRIGATETEGVDAGKPRTLAAQQFDRACRDAHVQAVEIDMFVRRVEVQRCGQVVVLERQDRLHHTEEAGGRFGVADVRFDRADRNRCPAVGADDRADGPDFRGVADLGARAVTFDEGDLVGIDAVAFVDRPQQVRLGFARRQGDAVGPAGGIDA
ncbi:hypothetical protein D3C87_1531100 [compost metagenome]